MNYVGQMAYCSTEKGSEKMKELSKLEIDELASQLAIDDKRLSDRDQLFANSLLNQVKRGLSQKQAYWLGVLVSRTNTSKNTKNIVELGSFTKVRGLLGHAKKWIKFPKIRLYLDENTTIQLFISRENTKYPNMVYVTKAKGYKWYGYIDKEGKWTTSYNMKDEFTARLTKLLVRLAENPIAVTAEHGKLTGTCSYCGHTLTDNRSTDVGYGPVCAKHFGLPWGEISTTDLFMKVMIS